MVKTSSRGVDETTNVDRQIELTRVLDEGMEMVLCQGAHVSLKPPVREEKSFWKSTRDFITMCCVEVVACEYRTIGPGRGLLRFVKHYDDRET
jgi:hypothetical protein